jgi:hypothetical protein
VSRPRAVARLAFGTDGPDAYPLPPGPSRYAAGRRHFVRALRATWPRRRPLVVYLGPDADPVAVVALLAALEEVHRTRRARLVAVRLRGADDAWVPVLVGQEGPLRPYPRVPLDPLPLPPGLITRAGGRVWPLGDGTVLGAGLVPSDTPDARRVHRAAVQAAAALAVPGAGIALSGAPLPVLLGAASVFGTAPTARVARWTLGRSTVPVLEIPRTAAHPSA